MSWPVIPADAEFLVWAALFVCVGVGFWAQRCTAIGAKYSGIMITMTAAMVLSNLRIIPTSSEVYNVTWDILLPIAIPLLLFRTNIRRVVREAGPLLIAFGVGIVGVVLGTVVATALVPLGDELKAPVAGVLTATYIGGSANFTAVAVAADFKEGAALTATVAADIIATNLHTIAVLVLPGLALVQRHFVNAHGNVVENGGAAPLDDSHFRLRDLDLVGLAYALAMAAAIAGLGHFTADLLDRSGLAIVFSTLYALLLANLAPGLVKRFSGDTEAANFMLFLFLAALAATADIWDLADLGPILFLYIGIMLTVHVAITFIGGWLLKIDVADLVIASMACVGGASSAGAIASSKGWKHLVTPGILIGMLGYAVGTFIGVAVWEFYS